jgi:hypothetical protein
MPRPLHGLLKPIEELGGRVDLVVVLALWEDPPSHAEGIFADSGLGGASEAAKKSTKSVSYGPIPNMEFFCGLQGIKSGDQGNFRPDQGIPLSSAVFAQPPRQAVGQAKHLAIGETTLPIALPYDAAAACHQRDVV